MMKMKVNNTDIDDRQKTNFDKKKKKNTTSAFCSDELKICPMY